ncbi:DNA methyltransferase [Kaistia algarum]|uniref:DNA cytosine methyltransferase n=1 Tax=Kaistia algarum TaxID=2083279 RepID=UPI000CE90749|nr:DNA cytosine methyltransferase [Kaistia algarum]MCX5516182.1 DNA cytosine methyltransferase [Kaistia algarum]PPE78256.1 DNA methyltransferase [Kaistia algarum]
MRELVIDSFAGGGGASEGICMALGRDPDIAVNHDPFALAMHRVNHPGTRHMVQDVATVDSVGMCAGRPIGMLWMSPDCTDHSKAKGAAPRREAGRTTRGIGWAIVGWVKALPKRQRPRVVFLENVEEYVDWGPLGEDGRREAGRKGETFKAFVAAWRALGYTNIEWRQRRAWWSGSGTIRKRLYMIMRRDGQPIVWPEREFGNPNDAADAAAISAGALRPWVTVADCLDFGLPCPSIFASVAEIRERHGVRAKRPLAPKTMSRVAKGVKRYVLDAPKPFLVKVNHTARGEARDRSAEAPAGAMTGKRDDALVTPFVTKFRQNSIGHPVVEPAHTITPHASETHGGGAAPMGLVAPVLAYAQQGGGIRSAEDPAHTFTASAKDQNVLLAPYLVPRYGEREGQEPRTAPADRPGPTPVPTGNEGSLAAVHMMTMRDSGAPSSPADHPGRTLVADGAAETLVAVHVQRQFGNSVGGSAEAPNGTDTAGGGGKSAMLAASFVAQHNTGLVGHELPKPISTIVGKGSTQQLVAASMLSLRGSDRRDAPADEPARTNSAQGQHDALVSLPLMTVYYGNEQDGEPVDTPGRTETTRDRFGLVEALAAVPPFSADHEPRARAVADFLRAEGCWDGGEFVTIEVEGVMLVLVDIGMRMLTPRERFNANGFPPGYVIDHGIDEHGNRIAFTLEQQGYMCGNAVCPTEARALVAANYIPAEIEDGEEEAALPLFLEAAE